MQENELKSKLENESDIDSIMRLAKKIVANSFYPVAINDAFYCYSKELADQITKEGKKQLRILINIMPEI